MRKQVEESVAAEGARRTTGAAAERDRKGRFSARRKRAVVLRLVRGEDLEAVARELGITAARAGARLWPESVRCSAPPSPRRVHVPPNWPAPANFMKSVLGSEK